MAYNSVTSSVPAAQDTSLVGGKAPFDNRVLRVLVISPAGRTINRFQSIPELLKGLRDAIEAHRSLLTAGKILHRDISENNIILTDSEGAGVKGMLIDLDNARELDQRPSGALHRTGTIEFMAIEVLMRAEIHTYRHDLEAFFYVLIWLCARQGWDFSNKKRPKNSLLVRWYTGKFDDIVQTKLGNMTDKGFPLIMKEFPPEFNGVKSLCDKIKDILFGRNIFIGTPEKPDSLYIPIIKAFDETLETYRKAGTEFA